MRGIRSFMGWSHIPDIDSSSNQLDDDPFADPKKIECHSVEGYHSRSPLPVQRLLNVTLLKEILPVVLRPVAY